MDSSSTCQRRTFGDVSSASFSGRRELQDGHSSPSVVGFSQTAANHDASSRRFLGLLRSFIENSFVWNFVYDLTGNGDVKVTAQSTVQTETVEITITKNCTGLMFPQPCIPSNRLDETGFIGQFENEDDPNRTQSTQLNESSCSSMAVDVSCVSEETNVQEREVEKRSVKRENVVDDEIGDEEGFDRFEQGDFNESYCLDDVLSKMNVLEPGAAHDGITMYRSNEQTCPSVTDKRAVDNATGEGALENYESGLLSNDTERQNVPEGSYSIINGTRHAKTKQSAMPIQSEEETKATKKRKKSKSRDVEKSSKKRKASGKENEAKSSKKRKKQKRIVDDSDAAPNACNGETRRTVDVADSSCAGIEVKPCSVVLTRLQFYTVRKKRIFLKVNTKAETNDGEMDPSADSKAGGDATNTKMMSERIPKSTKSVTKVKSSRSKSQNRSQVDSVSADYLSRLRHVINAETNNGKGGASNVGEAVDALESMSAIGGAFPKLMDAVNEMKLKSLQNRPNADSKATDSDYLSRLRQVIQSRLKHVAISDGKNKERASKMRGELNNVAASKVKGDTLLNVIDYNATLSTDTDMLMSRMKNAKPSKAEVRQNTHAAVSKYCVRNDSAVEQATNASCKKPKSKRLPSVLPNATSESKCDVPTVANPTPIAAKHVENASTKNFSSMCSKLISNFQNACKTESGVAAMSKTGSLSINRMPYVDSKSTTSPKMPLSKGPSDAPSLNPTSQIAKDKAIAALKAFTFKIPSNMGVPTPMPSLLPNPNNPQTKTSTAKISWRFGDGRDCFKRTLPVGDVKSLALSKPLTTLKNSGDSGRCLNRTFQNTGNESLPLPKTSMPKAPADAKSLNPTSQIAKDKSIAALKAFTFKIPSNFGSPTPVPSLSQNPNNPQTEIPASKIPWTFKLKPIEANDVDCYHESRRLMLRVKKSAKMNVNSGGYFRLPPREMAFLSQFGYQPNKLLACFVCNKEFRNFNLVKGHLKTHTKTEQAKHQILKKSTYTTTLARCEICCELMTIQQHHKHKLVHKTPPLSSKKQQALLKKTIPPIFHDPRLTVVPKRTQNANFQLQQKDLSNRIMHILRDRISEMSEDYLRQIELNISQNPDVLCRMIFTEMTHQGSEL